MCNVCDMLAGDAHSSSTLISPFLMVNSFAWLGIFLCALVFIKLIDMLHVNNFDCFVMDQLSLDFMIDACQNSEFVLFWITLSVEEYILGLHHTMGIRQLSVTWLYL